jgi:hypothetical protein
MSDHLSLASSSTQAGDQAHEGAQKGIGKVAQKNGHPMLTRSEERVAGGARVSAGSG